MDIGAGIGAIFSAPFGGAVIASEILYRDDFECEALLPGLVASILGYSIFGSIYGFHPLFSLPTRYIFNRPIQLLWFALIGVLAGGIGLLYSKTFYGLTSISNKLPLTRMLRPALGGLLVGLIALAVPEVLGTGYGWVQLGISNELIHSPLLVIVALPFLRILATSLSIGTGGSGGVFGPGMVIGAFTGLAVWRILEPIAHSVGHSPAPYVVVGMMAVFGGISRAPIAVMVMVAEMTGSILIVAPAMAAVALSWFIVRQFDETIYRSQPRSRSDRPSDDGLSPLRGCAVRELMSLGAISPPVAHNAMLASEALELMEATKLQDLPVVDERGNYLGLISVGRIEQLLVQDSNPVLTEFVDTQVESLLESTSASTAIATLIDSERASIPVVDEDGKVIGILNVDDIVRLYQNYWSQRFIHQEVFGRSVISAQVAVTLGSPLAGRRIKDAELPVGSVVVAIRRVDSITFPGQNTEIRLDDELYVIIKKSNLTRIQAMSNPSRTP